MSFSTMPRWHTIKEGRVEQTDSVQRTLHRVPQCPAWTSWNRSKEYLIALSISFQLTSRKLRVAESEKREKPAELQTALKSQTHQLITEKSLRSQTHQLITEESLRNQVRKLEAYQIFHRLINVKFLVSPCCSGQPCGYSTLGLSLRIPHNP